MTVNSQSASGDNKEGEWTSVQHDFMDGKLQKKTAASNGASEQ